MVRPSQCVKTVEVASLYALANALQAIHFARQNRGEPLPDVSIVNRQNGYQLTITER